MQNHDHLNDVEIMLNGGNQTSVHGPNPINIKLEPQAMEQENNFLLKVR